MNILHHKSWHVRTKKNIERVRRDEAKAAEEEKELKRRIRLAEQEARTELLRKRAKGDNSPQNSDNVKEHTDSDNVKEHINFFKEIEETGGYEGSFNKEHAEEEKSIKEKFEKDIGLLTYLGQSSLEAKGVAPWYLKSNAELLSSDGKDDTVGAKHKSKVDPLNEMKQYLALKEKSSGGKEIFLQGKVKDHNKSSTKKESSPKKLSKIEELRAKRLKREAEEKKKSQKFLENLRKGPSEAEEVILDDRARKYNSQFNPHLARNNLYTREY